MNKCNEKNDLISAATEFFIMTMNVKDEIIIFLISENRFR